jgi:hypothetical protein
MATVKAFYPEFVPNQVLTNTQLNQLREHLDLQDRVGRVLTVGTGKVCGLSWSVGDDGRVVVSEGYGITSDGYIVKLERETTFTHFRKYQDPDVDEEKKPLYELWRTSPDVLELLDSETMDSDDAPDDATALGKDTGEGRVVVLYLEREPVSLRSCLVTDCDNKGLNINLNLRALLVPRNSLAAVEECPDPPAIARIPRLHTSKSLGALKTGFDINQGYRDIILEALEGLAPKIGALQSYRQVLNLDEDLLQRFNSFKKRLEEATINQYHYDALKDLASAYNEAITAACDLINECCPELDFPRHLMLGAVDETPGFSHEFRPSAVRNVFEGDLERVRRMFLRVGALCEHADFVLEEGPAITPSHRESEPLGRRAVPFYYDEAVEELWQPKLCCTTDRLWSYDAEAESADLDLDYYRCTFLRIEGHLGQGHEVAREALVRLRKDRNVEFDVVCTYLSPPSEDKLDVRELQRERDARLARVKALLFQLTEVNPPLGIEAQIEDHSAFVIGANQGIQRALFRWAQARAARKLHCDFSHVRASYLALREQLLCTYHRLRGALDGAAEELEAKLRATLSERDLRPLARGAKLMLADRIAAAMAARITGPTGPASSPKSLRQQDVVQAIVFTMVNALDSLRENLRSFLAERLPKDIGGLDVPLFLEKQKDVARDIQYWMLLSAAYDVSIGEGEEGKLLDGEMRTALSSCHHRGIAALQIAYERMRSRDLGDFANLAAEWPGLEHLAGVEKGGTFVLVAENVGGREEVVADFTLSGKVACCCETIPEPLCLPPAAQLDYRIVTLSGNGPVRVEIDVLGNDYDPNHREDEKRLAVSVEQGTELGGRVSMMEDGRVLYRHESPPAGAVDRFTYTLTSSAEVCPGSSTGDVLVLLLPEAVKTGIITGSVSIDDIGPAPGSTVRILQSGQSTLADSKGRFEFRDIAGGSYTLVASGDGRTSEPKSVDVEADETVDVELVLARRTGQIRGIVLFSANKPVPECLVELDTVARTQTDGNGKFEFAQVIPGAHQLRATFVGLPPKQVRVTVEEGGTLSVEILFDAQVQTGTVRILVMDPAGVVLPGVVVTLLEPTSGSRREAMTNEKGEARFQNVSVGVYDATVELAGFDSVAVRGIEVKAGQAVERQIVLEARRRFLVTDEFVSLVATRNRLSQSEARARVEALYGERYDIRLSSLRAPDFDPSVRNSTSFARTEEFIEGRLTQLEPDGALTGSYLELVSTLSRAIASASPTNKAAYRAILINVSLGFLDRLTLTNPDSLSRDAMKGLENLAGELERAGVKAGEFGAAWGGARLERELGLRSVRAILEMLR